MTLMYIMQFLNVRQNITIQFKETQRILSITLSHSLGSVDKIIHKKTQYNFLWFMGLFFTINDKFDYE